MTKKTRNLPDFIIIGLQKSGTSWLSNMLNMHPEVACIPNWPDHPFEWNFFSHLSRNNIGVINIGGLKSKKLLTEFKKEMRTASAKRRYDLYIKLYYDLCALYKGDKKYFGEKSPSYISRLDFIDTFYSPCRPKKICIIRGIKDRIVSAYFMDKALTEKSGIYVSSNYMKKYCRKIELEYEALLNYKGKMLCVQYEDLLKTPNKIFVEVLQYLNVSVDNSKVIVRANKFKQLKDTLKNSKFEDPKKKKLVIEHLRVGKSGSWQEHLNQSDSRWIDKNTKLASLEEKVKKKFKLG